MDFATMSGEQIALFVAFVVVFGVVPLGWLLHDILKDKKAAASAPAEQE